MASKSIAGVGLWLPNHEVEYVALTSKKSLLEYDIILFHPVMNEFYATEDYNGAPCYSQSTSREVSAAIEHWQMQLAAAYDAGRTIIIFLPPKNGFWIHTGEKQFSGTGRSRVTTNIVTPHDNYRLIPVKFQSLTTAEGSKMEIVADYPPLKENWRDLKDVFRYKAYFDHATAPALLKVKGTKNIIAAKLNNSEGGTVLLMPDFAFDFDDEWTEPEEQEADEAAAKDAAGEEVEGHWSPRSLRAGDALVRFALSAEAASRLGAQVLAEPEWAKQAEFTLPPEKEALRNVAKIEKEIAELQNQLELQQSKLAAARKSKALLYGKGPPLEDAVRDFFLALGLDARNEVGPDIEFDIVLEVDGQRVIGEVEGKDSKAIAVDKISQLERCLQEDFARDGTSEFAKGILFGNGFRLEDSSSRGVIFTDKVLAAARRSGIVLVDTRSLFPVLKAVMLAADASSGLDFVRRMVAHPGGVFPPPE